MRLRSWLWSASDVVQEVRRGDAECSATVVCAAEGVSEWSCAMSRPKVQLADLLTRRDPCPKSVGQHSAMLRIGKESVQAGKYLGCPLAICRHQIGEMNQYLQALAVISHQSGAQVAGTQRRQILPRKTALAAAEHPFSPSLSVGRY